MHPLFYWRLTILTSWDLPNLHTLLSPMVILLSSTFRLRLFCIGLRKFILRLRKIKFRLCVSSYTSSTVSDSSSTIQNSSSTLHPINYLLPSRIILNLDKTPVVAGMTGRWQQSCHPFLFEPLIVSLRWQECMRIGQNLWGLVANDQNLYSIQCL